MNLKRCLILIVFAAIADSANAQGKPNCFQTELVKGDSHSTIAYSYDINNHINGFAMTGGGTTINYTATTNALGWLTSFTIKGTATGFVITKAKLTYDKNNNLIQNEEWVGTNTMPFVIENRKYSPSGQLTEVQQIIPVNGPHAMDSAAYTYYIYSYPNTTTKNPDNARVFGANGAKMKASPDQTMEFTYDNNPAVNDYPGSPNQYEAFAVNNVASAAIKYISSSVDENRVSTFTYNSQGYPVTRTYKANGGVTCVDTFTYSCK